MELPEELIASGTNTTTKNAHKNRFVTMQSDQNKFKILFIWDMAGIGSRIAQYINSHGLGTAYVIHRKAADRFSIVSQYSFNVVVDSSILVYYLHVMWHLMTFRPNIIHVNSLRWGVILARVLRPRTPILMHFHGSDIRKRTIPRWISPFVTKMIVSTRDLVREGVDYFGYPTE